jgi:ribosomal protein S15P/S13E
MLKTLRSLWGNKPEVTGDNDSQAEKLSAEISELETQLQNDPRNNEVQKRLMLTYNRALNVFASSPRYRSQVESLFERIDELRNVIRRNI